MANNTVAGSLVQTVAVKSAPSQARGAGRPKKTTSCSARADLPAPDWVDIAYTALAAKEEFGERVIQELAAIAFADMGAICSWDGELVAMRDSQCMETVHTRVVAEIAQTASVGGRKGTIKIKLYNKLKALELLGRHFCLFGGTNEHIREVLETPESLLPFSEKIQDLLHKNYASSVDPVAE